MHFRDKSRRKNSDHIIKNDIINFQIKKKRKSVDRLGFFKTKPKTKFAKKRSSCLIDGWVKNPQCVYRGYRPNSQMRSNTNKLLAKLRSQCSREFLLNQTHTPQRIPSRLERLKKKDSANSRHQTIKDHPPRTVSSSLLLECKRYLVKNKRSNSKINKINEKLKYIKFLKRKVKEDFTKKRLEIEKRMKTPIPV
ncbi:unnamed protein product [Moneuplotes crassus]|uniref:Uncharacterized protein n=1 Tax=Euplotes crassus TaxID=5936 RepID=A0AAD2CYF0_EUPCR|nr:unnamed protein product [Moneuplotes crassus]